MCGRFALATTANEIASVFDCIEPQLELSPRYNIAPTQDVPVIRERKSDGKRVIESMRWGLVPHWAKDLSIGNKMINARSETAAEKPSFRSAMKTKRCVIPADGFFEWQKTDDGSKQPFYIYPKNQSLLAFAGLWATWQPPDDEKEQRIVTFTILTTSVNNSLKALHHRMPVILAADELSQWLDPENEDTDSLQPLMDAAPDDLLAMHPVSRRVNKPANDSKKNIERIEIDKKRDADGDATLFG